MSTPDTDEVGPHPGQRVWPGGPIRHTPIGELEAQIARLQAVSLVMAETLDKIEAICEGTPTQPFADIAQRCRAAIADWRRAFRPDNAAEDDNGA